VSIPVANVERIERMHGLLTTALMPELLEITDDSHRHIGHAGARDGRGHFSVSIVSRAFAGLSSVARHRAIYQALGEMMTTDIHALSIQARSPSD
jgi:BolA protein